MPDLATGRAEVVALHGFTGGAASWDAVRRHLPEGVSLVALDLPGHAGWEGELPSSFEATVDALAERIRRREATVHLAGYSLGARLALGLLVRHPDFFRSATLIGVRPGLAAPARDERALRDEALADELLRDGLEAFVDRWQRLPLFSSQRRLPDAVLAAQRRQRLRHEPEGLAWALRVLSPGRMPDYRERLGAVACSVTLLVGEEDETFVQIARDLASAFGHHPTCDVEVVAGAGHNLPLEAPRAVADALVASVERIVERASTPEHPAKERAQQPAQQPA